MGIVALFSRGVSKPGKTHIFKSQRVNDPGDQGPRSRVVSAGGIVLFRVLVRKWVYETRVRGLKRQYDTGEPGKILRPEVS